jgi:GNAT superfamily N-acetyltransferase
MRVSQGRLLRDLRAAVSRCGPPRVKWELHARNGVRRSPSLAQPGVVSAARYRDPVETGAIEIREFEDDDVEAIVEFSLRAWEPVFTSVRAVLGEDIFLRLHPNWRADQTEAVRSSCTNDERDVFVAVANGRPVGFVAVALNAFHERMGWIDIIGVDPDYQRRGISSRLTEHAIHHMRSHGMDIAVVETGGDPGHAPARAAYEAAGFSLLPIARFFRRIG